MKRDIRTILSSLRFQAKRLEELLQDVEKISPSDPKPVKKKLTTQQLTEQKLQNILNR
jgi:hypothetical protein